MNLFRLKDGNYTDQKFNGSALLLVVLVLACFAISPMAKAVVPAPDGGYPGGNTAEGQNALLSLTSGGYNTAVGFFSLFANTTGSFNTAVGAGALDLNTGDNNTATGAAALLLNTTGTGNTANGSQALFRNTGSGNTANGYGALASNTTGVQNTANGYLALESNTTGLGNIGLGSGAGNSVTTANNVICIGAVSGANVSNSCFIGNIRGVTTVNTAIPVLIDTVGQLGTASSSRRFKKEIKPMDQTSEAILALKPVTFHYKSDPAGAGPQFGLIAEDVAAVNPGLVVRDKNGEIYTVRYDAVNAMLLNEFLKEHKAFLEEQHKVQEQQATITQLKKDFGATIAQLTARLDEQAAQIQKVSAQLEAGKPAPQVVNNP
jgi:hypothetical protein